MRERNELERAIAQILDPANKARRAWIEREGESEHGAEAGGVLTEKGTEGMEEGEEVRGMAGGRWEMSWGEESGDYQAVDGVRRRGSDIAGNGLEDGREWVFRSKRNGCEAHAASGRKR